MTHQITLRFEDGAMQTITCRTGETVADAALRARISIPLDCRDGVCGTCKATCASGDYQHGDYVDDALSVEEASAGRVPLASNRPSAVRRMACSGQAPVALMRMKNLPHGCDVCADCA